jgi:sugar O-acyltransferase (sialic acid O-acetyltransferase NeuD family)
VIQIKKIIILGAAGDGRNIADSIEETIIFNKGNVTLVGFLDDDPSKQNILLNNVPVLGTFRNIDEYIDHYFITSFGSPHNNYLKKEIIDRLNIPSKKYITIYSINSTISRYSTIGNGCFLGTGTIISVNVKIGDHVKILQHTVIGHDSIISDYCSIANSVAIAGKVEIGSECYIGMNVSIKEGVKIAKGSILGMGSVIISDIPPYSKVVGVPGRVIQDLRVSSN